MRWWLRTAFCRVLYRSVLRGAVTNGLHRIAWFAFYSTAVRQRGLHTGTAVSPGVAPIRRIHRYKRERRFATFGVWRTFRAAAAAAAPRW